MALHKETSVLEGQKVKCYIPEARQKHACEFQFVSNNIFTSPFNS
jgi:hypothetical protein